MNAIVFSRNRLDISLGPLFPLHGSHDDIEAAKPPSHSRIADLRSDEIWCRAPRGSVRRTGEYRACDEEVECVGIDVIEVSEASDEVHPYCL